MPWSPQDLRRAIVELKVITSGRVSVTSTYGDYHQLRALVVTSRPVKFYYISMRMNEDHLVAVIDEGDRAAEVTWYQRYPIEAWFRCWVAGRTRFMDVMAEAHWLLDEPHARLDLEGVRRRVKEE